MTDDLDIRREDLLGVRRSGTVLSWEDDKGYGQIAADDGEVLWAHFSGLEMDGHRSLGEGQRVSFVWTGGVQDHGRHRADQVRPLGADGSEVEPTRPKREDVGDATVTMRFSSHEDQSA